MLQKLDQFILDKFERFSHWTQRVAGITSAHWTQFAFLMAVLYAIKEAMESDWGVRIIIALNIIWFIKGYHDASKKDSLEGNEATANVLKLPVFAAFRIVIFFVGLIALPRAIISNQFYFIFMVLAWYFEACDDLPPSKSKLSQLIESFNSTPEPATEAA